MAGRYFDWYRCPSGESIDRDPLTAGELTIERVEALVARLPSLIRPHAEDLMSRHGYTSGGDGSGPHANVLGHPLVQLPLWVDEATDGEVDDSTMSDVLESSVCGYISVRAEDDYFDGGWDEPKEAMLLSGVFRARHQALLARHISEKPFWDRFEEVWAGYANAMLFETRLNEASTDYGASEFDVVLARSQPLEIPADAVLSLKGHWELAGEIAALVRHLAMATQLFDDFVDAPADLASGNYTWMVRRLSGMQGARALRRSMVESCDQVFAEASAELDRAVEAAVGLEASGLAAWVDARKAEMRRASHRMYETLFEKLGLPDAPEPPDDA